MEKKFLKDDDSKMLKITKNLYLKEILKSDSTLLYNLMKEIYPPAYTSFWEDNGDWYIETQYSKSNIEKELAEKRAPYYFIIYNDEIVGNFRILWNECLNGLSTEKTVKLHRVYLHQKVHGKGIGKDLISWLEKEARKNKYKIVWLDAMNKQEQAFQFYKKIGFKYHSHTFLDFEKMHDSYRKMSQVYKRLD